MKAVFTKVAAIPHLLTDTRGKRGGREGRGGEGRERGQGGEEDRHQIHKGVTQCSLVHLALYQWTVSSTEMMQ